ncbi:hypothetical protein M231_07472 [Tremella mesenterica]|uniref:PHD-type domain-containing protein n=1 Tax=Tremella mesenterica TaxID=5217 RepID=A0A4Q1BC66_TREME|nr:hypothetical protein M231_07472 [Tremella mesenterica]
MDTRSSQSESPPARLPSPKAGPFASTSRRPLAPLSISASLSSDPNGRHSDSTSPLTPLQFEFSVLPDREAESRRQRLDLLLGRLPPAPDASPPQQSDKSKLDHSEFGVNSKHIGEGLDGLEDPAASPAHMDEVVVRPLNEPMCGSGPSHSLEIKEADAEVNMTEKTQHSSSLQGDIEMPEEPPTSPKAAAEVDILPTHPAPKSPLAYKSAFDSMLAPGHSHLADIGVSSPAHPSSELSGLPPTPPPTRPAPLDSRDPAQIDSRSQQTPMEEDPMSDLPPSPASARLPSSTPHLEERDGRSAFTPGPPLVLEEGEEELEEGDDEIMADDSEDVVSVREASEMLTPAAVKSKGKAKQGVKSKPAKIAPVKKAGKGRPAQVKEAAKKAMVKGKGKAGKTNGAPKADRSVSIADSTPVATVSVVSAEIPGHREESVDSDDNAVYCICRKPYSQEPENVVMVGCDACDDWFHPPCVGLSGKQVETLDSYICKSCEARTGQKPRYKLVCHRAECVNPIVGKPSKYCSPLCAFRHGQSLIPAVANKRQLKQLHDAFVSYPPPPPKTTVSHHISRPVTAPTTVVPTSDILHAISDQLTGVKSALEVVRKRQRILSQAIERWETLGNVLPPPEPEDGTEERGRWKRKHAVKEEKMCGWDERLSWDDVEVNIWDGEHWEGEVCGKGKRCERHLGWQKTVGVSLDLEQGVLEKRQKDLSDRRQQMAAFLDSQEAGRLSRETMLAKLAAVK